MRAYLRIGSDYLEDAKMFDTIKDARDHFEGVSRELARFGQEVEASIHFYDRAIEDAPHCHEYPEYVLHLGPRGGVRMERA